MRKVTWSLPLASVDSRLMSILKMDASSSSSHASAGRGKPSCPSCTRAQQPQIPRDPLKENKCTGLDASKILYHACANRGSLAVLLVQ